MTLPKSLALSGLPVLHLRTVMGCGRRPSPSSLQLATAPFWRTRPTLSDPSLCGAHPRRSLAALPPSALVSPGGLGGALLGARGSMKLALGAPEVKV